MATGTATVAAAAAAAGAAAVAPAGGAAGAASGSAINNLQTSFGFKLGFVDYICQIFVKTFGYRNRRGGSSTFAKMKPFQNIKSLESHVAR
jgi:hydrogenase/urease accessory protein HupE